VLEFATCPFDRGTLPNGWRAGNSRTGTSGRRFRCPREQSRAKAQAFLTSYPQAAYMSEVERWRELPGGAIEFTMRRLRTAD
jgi:hypothetical protein